MTSKKVWETINKQHRWFERHGRKSARGTYSTDFRGEKNNGNAAPSVGWGHIPVACAEDWSSFCELLVRDGKLGEVLRTFPNRHAAQERRASTPTQKVILAEVKAVTINF